MNDTRRVCVRGVVVRDNQLFAVRHKDENGNPRDFWCTPGGGLDPLESLHDGLSREMIEETGVRPEIGRLLLVQQYSTKDGGRDGEKEQLEFFFEITNYDDFEQINLSNTTHGEAEVYEYAFVDPRTTKLLPEVLCSEEFITSLTDTTTHPLFYDAL